jgi:hypothetical protein
MKPTMIEEFTTARNALLNAATAIDSKRFGEASDDIKILQSQCDSIALRIEELLLLDKRLRLTS